MHMKYFCTISKYPLEVQFAVSNILRCLFQRFQRYILYCILHFYCDIVNEMTRSYKRKRKYKYHGNQFNEKKNKLGAVQYENYGSNVEDMEQPRDSQ